MNKAEEISLIGRNIQYVFRDECLGCYKPKDAPMSSDTSQSGINVKKADNNPTDY